MQLNSDNFTETQKWIGIGIAICIGVIVFFFLRWRRQKLWERVIEIASGIGIEAQVVKGFLLAPALPRFSGDVKGINVSLRTQVRVSNNTRSYYTKIEVSNSGNHDFSFTLRKENLIMKMGVALGMTDIETGNAEFDKSFIISSKHPEKVKALFDQNLCAKLLENRSAMHNSIEFNGQELSYQERGRIINETRKERFATLVDMMLSISEKVNKIRG